MIHRFGVETGGEGVTLLLRTIVPGNVVSGLVQKKLLRVEISCVVFYFILLHITFLHHVVIITRKLRFSGMFMLLL